MKNRINWNLASGLLFALTQITTVANGQAPDEALRTALEKLSPMTEHHSSRDFNAAIKILDRVIEKEPKHKAAYRCRGLAHLLTGNPEAAVCDFDSAMQLDPTDAVLYYGRGTGEQLLGNTERALADFKEAVRRKPGYLAAMAAQGPIFAERGMRREQDRIDEEVTRKARAIGDNEVLTDWRDSTDFAFGRHFDLKYFFVTPFWSMIYAEDRDLKYRRGKAALGETKTVDFETVYRTAVLQAASRDLDGALATLDRSIGPSPQAWRACRLRAAIWVIKDDPQKALASLNAGIELNPSERNLYLDRLHIHWELGDDDAAKHDDDELDRTCAERKKLLSGQKRQND